MEYSETISTVGVSNIVSKLSDLGVLWTDIQTKRRTHGILLSVIPITVSVRTCSMVASDYVIWMGDPNTSWRLICVQKTHRSSSINNQIVLDQILCLSGILNKDGVAQVLVSHIVLDLQVVYSMNGHSSVVSLPDSIVSDIGLVDCSNHMEMDWVSSKLEGLTHVVELYILNPSNARFISWGVDHDVGSILVLS
jgi:hypothetical protein